MTVVIGTAGHIDHGKTALLHALTGIDADRLPEEQARGMTIDVGYAHLRLADGREIDFVDVPGHDRLVGNMLVGAGEVDAVLLVVAADDGPRAQTIEHLELIDALGIRRGIVAITKADVVDDSRLSVVAADVRSLISPTRLAQAPILPVSAVSGRGLDVLTSELAALATELAAFVEPEAGRPRLAIDRAFSVRGRGVVVTGTLRGGSVGRGDRLRLVPGRREPVVREIQVHGVTAERARHGRTALNLRGVELGELHRGLILTTDPDVVAAERLLVALEPATNLSGADRPLPPDRARLRLHTGTDQVDVAVGRSGREACDLGDGRATLMLRTSRPVALASGDRFVLRRSAARRAEAGGVVLDPIPPAGSARRRVTPERLRALAAAGSEEERFRATVALHGGRRRNDHVVLAPDLVDRLTEAAVGIVGRHHRVRPQDIGPSIVALRAELHAIVRRESDLAPGEIDEAVDGRIRGVIEARSLVQEGDRVRDPSHRPSRPTAGVELAMQRLERALDATTPPPLRDAARTAGCPPEAIAALEREGRIVRLGTDLAWAKPAWERLARQALELASRDPLTPAALRDATGSSRKYVMALLEDLDRRAILRRTAEGHVPGPRARPVLALSGADGGKAADGERAGAVDGPAGVDRPGSTVPG